MNYLYEFDNTANSPLNHIAGEVQTLINAVARIFVPTAGLYYTESLVVTKVSNSATLLLGTDYEFDSIDSAITALTGFETAAAIVFINPALIGDVSLDYQAVGGPQGSNSTLVLDLRDRIDELKAGPLAWVDVVDKPSTYPPEPHLHDAPSDITGLDGLRDAMLQINTAIRDNRVVPKGGKVLTERLNRVLSIIAEQRIDINKLGLFGSNLNDVQVATDELTLAILAAQGDATNNLALANSAVTTANNTIANLVNIFKPIINSPADGYLNFNHSIDIITSAFLTSIYFYGAHQSTDWEITTDISFAVIDHSNLDDSINLLNYYPNGLTVSTLYYIRARFKSDNHVSEWSDVISFTTDNDLGYIVTPIITGPTEASTDIALKPVLQANVFSIIDGADTHQTTDWQISDIEDFSNIVYQALGSTDLVSHTVTSNLSNNIIYYFRCRYNGLTYLSRYSTPVSFTTLEFTEAVKLIGGATIDKFIGVVADSTSDNYICVGSSDSAGTGSDDAYIAIFDTDLNLINDKLIGGVNSDIFNDIIIDPNTGNYVCVGSTASAGTGLTDAYIAIFDTSLVLQSNRALGGIGDEAFNGIAFDPDTNNYICVGSTTTAGSGSKDGYIAVFDINLNLIDETIIGSTGEDVLFDVVKDSVTGNYIVVGESSNVGAGLIDALIIILDSTLTLVTNLVIGGASNETFNSILIDPNTDNYICVGQSASDGAGTSDAYIAIFNSLLTLQADLLIGGTGIDKFHNIIIDSTTGNYVCIGESASSGSGLTESFIAIFDTALVLQSNKLIGGAGDEVFKDIAVGPNSGDYICVGDSGSAGAGGGDAMVMTFIKNLTLTNGNIPSIVELIVSTPIFTETSPTFTETTPSLIETLTLLTLTTPTLTEVNPTLTETFSLY